MAIEFDGKQHFGPNFGGSQEKRIENFLRVKETDKIKNNYCSTTGIKLIRIAYTEIDNLENIITKQNLLNTKEGITYIGKPYSN